MILGLHHMTAISGPAQENVDFYAGILGLRLVKKTVNYDDPGAYHFYYGDGLGTPGSIITFFPYPDGYSSRPGPGQVTATSLSIPVDAMDYWIDRFAAENIPFEMPAKRGDLEVIGFVAPDGLQLELVADPTAVLKAPYAEGPVPIERAITGMHSVTLTERVWEHTTSTLEEFLGFEGEAREYEDRFVFELPGHRSRIDLRLEPHGTTPRAGRGSVHHIAFRIGTAEEQLVLREKLVQEGYNVSPVLDRSYFQSIYFREPGGVLFEVATDEPGFTFDEEATALGSRLMLPPQFEERREEIEAALPPIQLPTWTRG